MIREGTGSWRAWARRLVAHSVLAAQRHAMPLPPTARLMLGRVLPRLAKGSSGRIQGWDQPLLPDVPACGPQQDLSGEASAGEPSRRGGTEAGTYTAPVRGTGTSSALRCAILTESIDVGGMDEVVAFLARELPRHGVHVAVMHVPIDPDQAVGRLGQALRAEGVEVVDLRAAEARRWIDMWRPDVVSAHGAPDSALEAVAASGTPVVETLHGMHTLFGATRRDVAARADLLSAVVSVSSTVLAQYLSFGGMQPNRAVVIPNGLGRHLPPQSRQAARHSLGLTDEYAFVSLARHSLQKNSYGLLTAFEEVSDLHPGAHLVVAGRPDDAGYTAQLVELRSRLKAKDRIHLRDHMPDPGRLLAAADGFVLDSYFEGWSLASMEALAVGLPVVLAEVGGAREQIESVPACGHLVRNPLGDPLAVNWDSMTATRFRNQVNRHELVTAMSDLVTQRDMWLARREEIASAARAVFTPDECVARHLAVLTAVASGESDLRGLVTAEARSLPEQPSSP